MDHFSASPGVPQLPLHTSTWISINPNITPGSNLQNHPCLQGLRLSRCSVHKLWPASFPHFPLPIHLLHLQNTARIHPLLTSTVTHHSQHSLPGPWKLLPFSQLLLLTSILCPPIVTRGCLWTSESEPLFVVSTSEQKPKSSPKHTGPAQSARHLPAWNFSFFPLHCLPPATEALSRCLQTPSTFLPQDLCEWYYLCLDLFSPRYSHYSCLISSGLYLNTTFSDRPSQTFLT